MSKETTCKATAFLFFDQSVCNACNFGHCYFHLWSVYLTHKITFRDPNKGSEEVSFKWPRYTLDDKKHLNLRWPLIEGQDLFGNRYKLWKEDIATL